LNKTFFFLVTIQHNKEMLKVSTGHFWSLIREKEKTLKENWWK